MRTDFAQLRRLPDLLFPRRCPFCGSLLGPDALQGTVCPACVPEEMRLQHIPARLPEGEHDFYAVREAAAAYYYEDIVRTAVLRCKRGGCFWYARELADRVAVLVRGQLLAESPSRPALQAFLPQWREAIAGLKAPSKLRWHIEVDPLEF